MFYFKIVTRVKLLFSANLPDNNLVLSESWRNWNITKNNVWGISLHLFGIFNIAMFLQAGDTNAQFVKEKMGKQYAQKRSNWVS